MSFAATWSESTDETGQPVRYQMCLRARDERCDHERWFAAGPGGSRREAGTAQMIPGGWLLSCIRARDVEGNYSEEACSDGFRVMAAPSEIASVMASRAEVGLPSDRATVERQAREGAYGATWLGLEVPVAAGEEPDYTSLEFQTWTIDHGSATSALIASGIAPEVRRGTHVLGVVIADRACSPRDELRAAFGARAVDTAPSPIGATIYARPTDAWSRARVTRYVLSDPDYGAIGIDAVEYERRGVSYGCLDAVARWLARSDVRRHLAGAGFDYSSAAVRAGKVHVFSDRTDSLPGASALIDMRRPVHGSSIAV